MAVSIFPRPQWLQERDTPLVIEHPVRIAVSDARYHDAAEALAAGLHATFDIAAEIVAGHAPVLIGGLDDRTMVEALQAHGVSIADDVRRAGGYLLHSGPAGAVVAGFDPAGVFYGVQTLLQVATMDGARLALPGLDIRDWPYKPLRGIHSYLPGRDQIPFFKRLLAWLASLKYNTVFLEVSGGMEYERRPAVNAAWERFCREVEAYPGGPDALQNSQTFIKNSTHTELGGGSYLSKAEVRDLIAYARSLHIEIIPEVQSLSHCYYLCLAYPEIAERADDPYPDTYCPSNPLSYEILFDVMEEVIEVFQPRVLHIGHDEIYHLGICPRCQGKSGADLLAGNINRVHAFLKEHGVRLGMWGDKLLPIWVGGRAEGGMEHNVDDKAWGKTYHIPETYRAIEQLPRDILISDWYWCVDPLSTQYLTKQGFEVVLSNFGNNFGAQEFDRWNTRAAADSVRGAEVSTWCQVSEFALGYNGCIFNMLFAAQMLWWSHYRDIDRAVTTATVAAQTRVARRWLGDDVAPSRNTTVSFAALPVADVSAPFVQGEPAPIALPPGSPFQIGNVRNVPHPWYPAEVRVERNVDSLLLLHTCSTKWERTASYYLPDPLHHPPENLLGVYHIRYTDGSELDVPVHFGTHVANWDEPYGEHIDAVPYRADPIPAGTDPSGRRITLYQYEWVNPRPNEPVERITLAAAEGAAHPLGGALYLLAATAVTRQ